MQNQEVCPMLSVIWQEAADAPVSRAHLKAFTYKLTKQVARPKFIVVVSLQCKEDVHPQSDADKKDKLEEANSKQDEPEAAMLSSAQAALAECCSAAKVQVVEAFHKLIYVVLLAAQEGSPSHGEENEEQ